MTVFIQMYKVDDVFHEFNHVSQNLIPTHLTIISNQMTWVLLLNMMMVWAETDRLLSASAYWVDVSWLKEMIFFRRNLHTNLCFISCRAAAAAALVRQCCSIICPRFAHFHYIQPHLTHTHTHTFYRPSVRPADGRCWSSAKGVASKSDHCEWLAWWMPERPDTDPVMCFSGETCPGPSLLFLRTLRPPPTTTLWMFPLRGRIWHHRIVNTTLWMYWIEIRELIKLF